MNRHKAPAEAQRAILFDFTRKLPLAHHYVVDLALDRRLAASELLQLRVFWNDDIGSQPIVNGIEGESHDFHISILAAANSIIKFDDVPTVDEIYRPWPRDSLAAASDRGSRCEEKGQAYQHDELHKRFAEQREDNFLPDGQFLVSPEARFYAPGSLFG